MWGVGCGVWRVACEVWGVGCGAWCVVCGVWCVVCGVWCVVCGVGLGGGYVVGWWGRVGWRGAGPSGPVGSSSSQYRRTLELVLPKKHASFRITSSFPVQRIAADRLNGYPQSGI